MATSQRKAGLIVAAAALAALLFAVSLYKDTPAPEIITSTPDLSTHAIYSHYQFGGDNVIDVGTQPLYFPTGLITEMMKRDRILQQELSKLAKTIRYHSFLKGDDVNFFLKQGKLDVGIGGDMPAVSIAADYDVLIPILIQYGFTSIVASRPMQVSDLRGKRIAYAFGSNAHYTLLSALNSEGLTESDVVLVPMDISEMSEALISGEIDAFAGWEPTSTITLKKKDGCAAIRKKISTGYMYFDRSFAQENHQAVCHILAAEIRAIHWMQDNDKNLLIAARLNRQTEKQIKEHGNGLSDEEFIELAKTDILGMTAEPIISEELTKINGPLHKEFGFLQKTWNKWQSSDWESIKDKFDDQTILEVLKASNYYRTDESDYDLSGQAISKKR